MRGKNRRFNLKSFLMAYETPPADPAALGGGGTPPPAPVAPPVAPPAAPPANDPPALPDDVKAQLAELEKMKADKAKADEEATKKKEAEELAKKSIEEQLEATKKQVADMEQKTMIRDLRDKHEMNGAIYARLAATVAEAEPAKAEAALLAIKKEVDDAIAAEVEKAKGATGNQGKVSPTAGNPKSDDLKPASGVFDKFFGSK